MLNVTSCQNEEITEKQEGQMVTIQAAFGTGTRTTLEENGSGYATKWSAGDQIYVADEWGFVSGVLTLVEGEGKSSGTFSGVVSGNPAALSYAVFPVPSNGKISLNTADASQTDAPMSASISALKANFKNECGLVKLTVYNLPENADIRLSAKDISGSLQVNAQDGTILESSATGDEIKIQNAKSGQPFFVPVLAGDNPSQAEFTLSINGKKMTFKANIQKGKVTIDNVPEIYISGGTLYEKTNTVVSTPEDLANALENANPGAEIVLSENTNYGAIPVGELKDVTIEGKENSIMIFQTNKDTKIENVKIKSVGFEYTGATADCGIVINAEAQIDNLVVENCTFVGTGAKAGRGISGLNNSASIELKGCTFKDLGYPIYAWGGYESLTVEGCTFENIKSWAIMPQSGFDGDLTVTGCSFKDCKGGLVKAGTLTAGHTFTFTNNTVTNSTEHPNRNWFEFNTSAGTKVISGNTMDGTAWTPGESEGLK